MIIQKVYAIPTDSIWEKINKSEIIYLGEIRGDCIHSILQQGETLCQEYGKTTNKPFKSHHEFSFIISTEKELQNEKQNYQTSSIYE